MSDRVSEWGSTSHDVELADRLTRENICWENVHQLCSTNCRSWKLQYPLHVLWLHGYLGVSLVAHHVMWCLINRSIWENSWVSLHPHHVMWTHEKYNISFVFFIYEYLRYVCMYITWCGLMEKILYQFVFLKCEYLRNVTVHITWCGLVVLYNYRLLVEVEACVTPGGL